MLSVIALNCGAVLNASQGDSYIAAGSSLLETLPVNKEVSVFPPGQKPQHLPLFFSRHFCLSKPQSHIISQKITVLTFLLKCKSEKTIPQERPGFKCLGLAHSRPMIITSLASATSKDVF